MPAARPTPFDLVFHDVAESEFPAIRNALEKNGQDPRDRDAFLMLREVISLIRELRPEEGLGSGIDQLAALVHHAYLFWQSGSGVVALSAEELETLLAAEEFARAGEIATRPLYAQMPLRRVWARVVEDEAAEPLDGCFLHFADQSGLRVLGIFGMHPDRPGFSVVEISGSRPASLRRDDGTRLFSSALPGGDRAGLFSILGGEELLELGWRVELGVGSSDLRAPTLTSDLAPSS